MSDRSQEAAGAVVHPLLFCALSGASGKSVHA